MSGGSWGAYVAVGLIAGAGLAITLIVWLIGLNYCPGKPCKYYDSGYQNSAEGKRESHLWLPFAFGPNTTEELGPDDQQGRPGYHDRQDLRAQESVARATNAIVWLTFLSLIVGVVGVASVVITIGLNLQAIAVQREIGQAQVRAYIGVSVADFTVTPTHISFAMEVKNFGQSPAFDTQFRAAWSCKAGDFQEKWIDEMPIQSVGTMTPQRVVVRNAETNDISDGQETMTTEQVSELLEGKTSFWSFGKLAYRDAFGKRRETHFRFKMAKVRGKNSLKFCDEGNSAT